MTSGALGLVMVAPIASAKALAASIGAGERSAEKPVIPLDIVGAAIARASRRLDCPPWAMSPVLVRLMTVWQDAMKSRIDTGFTLRASLSGSLPIAGSVAPVASARYFRAPSCSSASLARLSRVRGGLSRRMGGRLLVAKQPQWWRLNRRRQHRTQSA